MNSDTEFEGIRMQNHHDDIYEMHDENEIQEPKAFKAFTKPVTAYKELRVPSSIQAYENNQRRRVEKPPTPPRVPLVRNS
jgi:hypothetical protein